MYVDSPPQTIPKVTKVLVLEEKDRNKYVVSEVIQKAREEGAFYRDGDREEIFCYVMESHPLAVEQATLRRFRRDLQGWLTYATAAQRELDKDDQLYS